MRTYRIVLVTILSFILGGFEGYFVGNWYTYQECIIALDKIKKPAPQNPEEIPVKQAPKLLIM